jgi:hypothetical protein
VGQSQKNYRDIWAAKAIIAEAGSLPPNRLSAAHVMEINARLDKSSYTKCTKALRARSLRRVLRWLWEYHGAPKLDEHVTRYPGIRPRNVTASREEIDTILNAASPHLRLWLLLCSDLAMRSTTAANIKPQDYNAETREVRFTTKFSEKLTLPVTREVHGSDCTAQAGGGNIAAHGIGQTQCQRQILCC